MALGLNPSQLGLFIPNTPSNELQLSYNLNPLLIPARHPCPQEHPSTQNSLLRFTLCGERLIIDPRFPRILSKACLIDIMNLFQPALVAQVLNKQTISSSSAQSESMPPRRRARIACELCHQRKVRCDVSVVGTPCTNCRLDSHSCSTRSSARFVIDFRKDFPPAQFV